MSSNPEQNTNPPAPPENAGIQNEPKYKLSPESAANELKKMFDYYEIDLDEIEDADLKKAIKQGYDRLIKAVRLGRLEIKIENGIRAHQHLRSGGDPLEYRQNNA